MTTLIASFLNAGILAFASLGTVPADIEAPIAETVTAEVAALEASIPETFNFVGFSAEENIELNARAGCNPRAVVNSIPALRACVIDGRNPGCRYDFDAEDVSNCPDGSLRFQVIIFNDDCPGPKVPIVEIFVCNCTVESWTCL